MIVKEDLMREKEEKYDMYYDDSISEAEETLSLCDLPLTYHGDWNGKEEREEEENLSNSKETNRNLGGGGRFESDQDFFEFFNDLNSEMKPAEDIIFCGKLLPYRSPHSDSHQSNQSHRGTSKGNEDHRESKIGEFEFKKKTLNHHHRKSDSDIKLLRSQSSVENRFLKNKSFDYRKLQRVSSSSKSSVSPTTGNDQIPGRKCFGKNVFSSRSSSISSSLSSQVKPKKQLVMFGVMKSPVEMELRDIRNRQNKRNPSSLIRVFDGEQTVSEKNNGGKGSWSLLRVLGCKGHANAVVTASLRCIPHV